MPTLRSMDELTLHTAGGVLYFGTGRPQAAVFDKGPKEFVNQEWVKQADIVRILGTEENAELIVELYNRRLNSGGPRILLCSPALCQLGGEPHDVIRQLMEVSQPPSVGGWHQMTKAHYQTYALILEVARKNKMTQTAEALLEQHPAAPALTFIGYAQPAGGGQAHLPHRRSAFPRGPGQSRLAG